MGFVSAGAPARQGSTVSAWESKGGSWCCSVSEPVQPCFLGPVQPCSPSLSGSTAALLDCSNVDRCRLPWLLHILVLRSDSASEQQARAGLVTSACSKSPSDVLTLLCRCTGADPRWHQGGRDHQRRLLPLPQEEHCHGVSAAAVLWLLLRMVPLLCSQPPALCMRRAGGSAAQHSSGQSSADGIPSADRLSSIAASQRKHNTRQGNTCLTCNVCSPLRHTVCPPFNAHLQLCGQGARQGRHGSQGGGELALHRGRKRHIPFNAMRTACTNVHSTQWAGGQWAGAAWWPGAGQLHTLAATEQLFTALAPPLLALLANDPSRHIASCFLSCAIHRRCAASRTMPPSLRCLSCPLTTTSRRAAVWQTAAPGCCRSKAA